MNLIQLQPDDVLVLCCPAHMSQEQRTDALAGLGNFLGPGRNVIILDAGQTLDVLRGVPAQTGTTELAPPGSSWTVDGEPLAEALAQREVQHVDTPDEEPAGIPPHVYLYRNMLTDLQRLAPLGIDETNGQYAVAIDQLTPEQMQVPHINKQLVQMRDDMCDHATKVWTEEAGVLGVAVDDSGEVAENEIVKRC